MDREEENVAPCEEDRKSYKIVFYFLFSIA